MATAGNTLAVTRPKTQGSWNITGILTSRDGSATAEAGGVPFVITAHALIPVNTEYTPMVGDRITHGGSLFMISSVIIGADDGAYSCDLISVQK